MPFKTISVKSSRFYSAHHMLLRIADECSDTTGLNESESNDRLFTSIALCSLALEPLCNAVGARAIQEWTEFESCNPKAKLLIICDHLNIEYKNEIEPWGTLRWLAAFRNKIAHPKAEQVEIVTEVIGWSKSNDLHRIAPKSKLEKIVNAANAKRAVRAMQQLVQIFTTNLPASQQDGISSDSWLTLSKEI